MLWTHTQYKFGSSWSEKPLSFPSLSLSSSKCVQSWPEQFVVLLFVGQECLPAILRLGSGGSDSQNPEALTWPEWQSGQPVKL